MTQIAVGAIADQLGAARRTATREFWACPASKFARTQPADIPVQADHGGLRIGRAAHIEHRAGKIWVVLEIGDEYDLSRQPWQLSYDLIERRHGYELQAVAVCERSASICLPDIEVRSGTLAQVAGRMVHQDGTLGELVRSAQESSRRRRSGSPLVVRDIKQEKLLARENERRSTYVQPLTRSSPSGQREPPQFQPNWRPGDLEWAQVGGQVLAVR